MKVYPSTVGRIYSGNVSDGLKKVVEELKATSLFIVADENTADLCVPKLKEIVSVDRIIMTRSGEANKNLETCKSIWSSLIKEGADRNSFILNVGGGVICDMGGFTAACYQRGIRFGHLPTTLLSMADAAIGGKLGIDYDGFKNYIGLIQVPSFIWIDKSFLKSLPEIEIVSGLGEIVKHAIIGSRSLWDLMSGVNAIEDIRWDEVLDHNIKVKVKIVESDLTEQGYRKVLNFGHTIGHALESFYLASGQPMTHGQCVALGMMVESKIAYSIGLLNTTDFEAIIELIVRLLDLKIASLPDVEKVRAWMLKDKKRSLGSIGFSLPDGIGTCRWDMPVEDQYITESFDWLRARVKSVPFRGRVEK